MPSSGPIAAFHKAADERFAFLLGRGFAVEERTTLEDRYGAVTWSDGLTQLAVSWETYGGELDARIDGRSLWPMATEAGLWDAGYGRPYQGHDLVVMQHGLDRIVTLLHIRPELLMLPRLLDIARRTQRGEIGAIEGSRLIAALRYESGDPENHVFEPFVGIDAQSDDLIVGERGLWAPSFLEHIDARYAAYERALQPGIAEDCNALLAVFEPRLRELRGSR